MGNTDNIVAHPPFDLSVLAAVGEQKKLLGLRLAYLCELPQKPITGRNSRSWAGPGSNPRYVERDI